MRRRITGLLGVILLLGFALWLAIGSHQQEPTTGIASPHSREHLPQVVEPITTAPTSKPHEKRQINPNDRAVNQVATSDLPPKYAHQDADFLAELNNPYGFSIEPLSQKLIWTSSGDETFKVANPDGTDVTAVQTNFEAPYHIKVENPFGYTLYFYADGMLIKKVVDTQLGEESEEVLLELKEQKIHGLGFNEKQGVLYLGDQFGQPALIVSLPINRDQPFIKRITPLNP